MIVHVANPIYDSVFKYLMEDERIAKTILSALLKKRVESVEMRPHEYTSEEKKEISMLRIDFGAQVVEDDGTKHIILIELQKTWVETETLRFRQYLGAQYANKNNIDKDSPKNTAYPMVAIYLMGHRVGDIDVPVLYVSHKAYDYDGKIVTHGIPDAFVDSLTHDSIIVQIPLLHGKINNHLDEVLSVFDQTKADADDPHLLRLDVDEYSNDDNMQYLVHRLTAAASSPKIRRDMNVEDEYYSALENRDTKIMMQDKLLRQKDQQLKQQNQQLEQQNQQLELQRDRLQNIAKTMLDKGMSVSDIVSMTGMSEEDIQNLQV